jgi:hypothetical protein
MMSSAAWEISSPVALSYHTVVLNTVSGVVSSYRVTSPL